MRENNVTLLSILEMLGRVTSFLTQLKQGTPTSQEGSSHTKSNTKIYLQVSQLVIKLPPHPQSVKYDDTLTYPATRQYLDPPSNGSIKRKSPGQQGR